MAIANSGLRHLRNERLCVAQKQELHFAIAMELILEALSDETVTVSCTLHDRPTRGGFAAHEQRYADEAVIAYHRNLRRGAVVEYIQQRYDGVGWEIDMTQEVAGLVQNLAERHGDEPQVRVKSLPHSGGEPGQQEILLRIMDRIGHQASP